MNQKQIRILNFFRENDHVNQCLDGQNREALNQLCDLFLIGHKSGLDWYITGGSNNTVRCGRKSIDDLQAKDQLIRISFTRKTAKVNWRAVDENTEWNEAKSINFNLLLKPEALPSLKKCISYLADKHKLVPQRDGFWPHHYNKLEIDQKFQKEIQESLTLSDAELSNRADQAPEYPTTKSILTVVFNRNPNIVAAALRRANGKCEYCKKNAPFLRRESNKPYLEVHHKIPLAKGGKDKLENVIALCPNCHREQHFGASPSTI